MNDQLSPKLIQIGNNFTDTQAHYTGLVKSGTQKIGPGTDGNIHFETVDELGTITPGSVSFKYYLHPSFYVYDKVTLTQNAYTGGVTLTKVDSENAETLLAGAEYSLSKDGTVLQTGLKTDANGTITVDSLVPGKYLFQETKAPVGYVLDENDVAFTIENKAVTLGGGVAEVTENDGTVTKAGPGEVFIAGGEVGNTTKEKSSPDIAITSVGATLPEAQVTVTYQRLTSGQNVETSNVVRTFPSIAEAQTDVNNEKNANTITGAVTIAVAYANPNPDGRVAVTHTNVLRKTVSLSGIKTWVDNEDFTGEHPEVTINLLQNGKEIAEQKLASGASAYSFADLDEYNADGTKYIYTVTEDAVAGYDAEYDPASLHITNRFVNEKISVSGTKTWIDNDAHIIPNPEITINLLQDGKKIKALKLKDGITAYSFVDLDKYSADGKLHLYTVTEDAVSGYKTIYDPANPMHITNQFINEKISVSGTKTWVDNANFTGAHPEIMIRLLQNGKEIQQQKLTSGEVTYSFTNLDRFQDDGTHYVYTVKEDAVAGYTTEYDVTNPMHITNQFINEKISVSGTKTWVDGSNQQKHPDITLHLLQDGVAIRQMVLKDGTTTYSFNNLDKFKANGALCVYTVAEDAVPGYVSVQDGFHFTNTYSEHNQGGETVTVNVGKNWVEKTGIVSAKPDSLDITLLQDNLLYAQAKLSEAEGWKRAFEQLPKFNENGNEYQYKIVEAPVEGYTLTNQLMTRNEDIWQVSLTNTRNGVPPATSEPGLPPAVSETGAPPVTGDNSPVLVLVLICAIALLLMGTVLIWRKRHDK